MTLRPAFFVVLVLLLAGCESSELPPVTAASQADLVDRPPSPELMAVLARSEGLPQSGVTNQQVARRVVITPRRPVRQRRVVRPRRAVAQEGA